MAVHYVSDFSFPKSPARPTVTAGARPAIHGYAKGGHVKASTPQPFSKGGSTTPFRYKDGGTIVKTPKAEGKVPQSKNSVNPGDASSPGSYAKSAPSQGGKNASVAKAKFAAPDVKPESTGTGNKQRMAAWSDFKEGGSTSKAFNRIQNLGHYAHGGKVKASGEKASGKAGSSKVKAPVSQAKGAAKYESKAGTPKTAPGSRVEVKSGTAKASMGGLSRGNSKSKNAAIHAKSSKPKAGALAAIAGALSQAPHQPAGPGIGAPPPGMAPGMGAPPGGAMGPRAAPPMAGGPMQAGMSHGGPVMNVVHHHVPYGG